MAFTRQERVAFHKKQEKIFVGDGSPSVNELKDGVPVFRRVGGTIIEYIKSGNNLFKSEFEKVGLIVESPTQSWQVLRYVVPDIDSTGIANGSAVVTDGIPAFFHPVLCTVSNMSTTAGDDFAAVACILDVETSGQKLCTTLSGLGDGESIHSVCGGLSPATVAITPASSAKDILAEAADFKSASGKTVSYEIIVSGWDLSVSAV